MEKTVPPTNEVLYKINFTLMNIREELEKQNQLLSNIEERMSK